MSTFKALFVLFIIATVALAAPIDLSGIGGSLVELGKSLTPEQQQQLKAITDNKEATKQQIKDQTEAFMQTLDGDAATKFNDMKAAFESKKGEFESKANEAMATMSEPAKELGNKIQEVMKNMNLTPEQERNQIKTLYDGAPEEVKTELKNVHVAMFGNVFLPTTPKTA